MQPRCMAYCLFQGVLSSEFRRRISPVLSTPCHKVSQSALHVRSCWLYLRSRMFLRTWRCLCEISALGGSGFAAIFDRPFSTRHNWSSAPPAPAMPGRRPCFVEQTPLTEEIHCSAYDTVFLFLISERGFITTYVGNAVKMRSSALIGEIVGATMPLTMAPKLTASDAKADPPSARLPRRKTGRGGTPA